MSDEDVVEIGPAAPRSFEGLRDALLSRKKGLPKRLAQVAAFTLANPDEVAFGTAASIAEQAQVQPSTLIRFAQALGYQGFSDLQTIFRDRLRERVPTYEERLQALRTGPETARAAALFEGFAEAAERSIRAVRSQIDPATIERAVDRLSKAETIYLIGQRRSFPVTSYMSYALGKLGIRNVLIGSAVGTDAETASFATPRDAALAVSFTPYASSAVMLARKIATRGAAMVVITDSPFSPIVPEDGIWFEIVEADCQGFRPMSATMVLAMTLAVAVAEARL
ncbi:MurR/RpiR family transcriptional regulator [Lichenihabitans psoromatis]|uniref:MurR/RpiR family transcriptional regulator n=1 Tax=Lichenihabitans psoromatis TaxID=2528642 RepID=UPI001035A80E|nr:MurR/RpiR family transcriptional regulator [Lichenihabitans psoromatis]